MPKESILKQRRARITRARKLFIMTFFLGTKIGRRIQQNTRGSRKGDTQEDKKLAKGP
jgi:hypothetical protein